MLVCDNWYFIALGGYDINQLLLIVFDKQAVDRDLLTEQGLPSSPPLLPL